MALWDTCPVSGIAPRGELMERTAGSTITTHYVLCSEVGRETTSELSQRMEFLYGLLESFESAK